MRTIEEKNKIPCRADYDILVAGGGLAGVAAAISAARAGKRVLLIEKSTKLGGLATLGLINLFVPMCDGRGRAVIGGLCEELLRLSIRYGFDTLPDEWREDEPGREDAPRYVSRFSAEIFALALTELMIDEGVDLLFDSVVSLPVMDGRRARGLIVENKSGREYYGAGIIVDATGDADIFHRAGAPTVDGSNYFTYSGFAIDIEHCRAAVESGRIDRALYTVAGGGATLYGQNQPNEAALYAGGDVREITDYTVKSQIALLNALKGQDRFSRDVVTLPGMPQFRTTRRIAGGYALKVSDQGERFEDSIGVICDFDNRGYLYEVPLRCLIAPGYDNLITAGRSAAAEGYAWDILRVIPPAILTGQAAGLAAARALDESRPINEVDISRLQGDLADAGLYIHIRESFGEGAGRGLQSTPSPSGDDIGHI